MKIVYFICISPHNGESLWEFLSVFSGTRKANVQKMADNCVFSKVFIVNTVISQINTGTLKNSW